MTPLLAELREGGLVGNVEALTATAAAAAADIQKLQVVGIQAGYTLRSGNGVGEKYALQLQSHGCCSCAVPFLPHLMSPLLLLLLQGAVLTDDNVRALHGSVLTLCRTLPPPPAGRGVDG